jgi:hypothetical protein
LAGLGRVEKGPYGTISSKLGPLLIFLAFCPVSHVLEPRLAGFATAIVLLVTELEIRCARLFARIFTHYWCVVPIKEGAWSLHRHGCSGLP